MRRPSFVLLLAATVIAGAARAEPACAPASSAKEVEAVVRGWFGAFARNDYQAGYALQTPGFYAYDNGQRYNGTVLGELVRSAKAAGGVIQWNLGPVDVHMGCDVAWAAWINKGAAGSSGAAQPETWLESAALRYQDGHWRMEFLHSDRVPPQNQGAGAQPQGRRRRD
jgi:hypothetical protein